MSQLDSTNLSALLHESEAMEAGIVESQSTTKLKETIQLLLTKMNEIVTVNNQMLEKIRSLQVDSNKIYDELYDQKVELAELNQYGRRENIELCGIPESVKQEHLEKHVLEVAKSMGVNVPSKGIHILHRIGKPSNSRPRNVIVRFHDRKTAFSMLKNKKKLNSGRFKKYFVTENLCPYNKRIFSKLYRLKKNNEIHSLWTYNGNVFVKIKENDERQQVYHLYDIDNLFGDSEAGSDDSRQEHVASCSESDDEESSPITPITPIANPEFSPVASPLATPLASSAAPGAENQPLTSTIKPAVPPKPARTRLSVVAEENSLLSSQIQPMESINI